MGYKAMSQIVAEGMKEAGRDGISVRMLEMLNEWLFSQYTSFPWPFLYQRATLTLTAGTTPLQFPAGTPFPVNANKVQRIFDPIYLRTSTYQRQRVCRIREVIDGPLNLDEATMDPTKSVGTPQYFKVRALPQAQWGYWQLVPFPFPDQDYIITFDYLGVPGPLLDSDAPVYPNDRTMVQVVKVYTQAYSNRKDEQDIELLRSLVQEDRERFGSTPGINDRQQLDGGVFL